MYISVDGNMNISVDNNMYIPVDENPGIFGDAPFKAENETMGENVPKSFCPPSFTLHHITCFNLLSKVLPRNF